MIGRAHRTVSVDKTVSSMASLTLTVSLTLSLIFDWTRSIASNFPCVYAKILSTPRIIVLLMDQWTNRAFVVHFVMGPVDVS